MEKKRFYHLPPRYQSMYQEFSSEEKWQLDIASSFQVTIHILSREVG